MTVFFLLVLDFVVVEFVHDRLLRFEETNTNSKADHFLFGKVGSHDHLSPIEEFKSVLIFAIAEISHQNLPFNFVCNCVEGFLEFFVLRIHSHIHNFFFVKFI